MRIARLATLLAVAVLLGAAHAASADTGAPTGLHAFMLRTDEPAKTSFSRTPAFAWNPVAGALRYEFQLSLSSTFRDNAIVYADQQVMAPVEAPGITLPWITDMIHARVRAITPDGATPWSADYRFNIAPPAAPAPLPSYPGVLRWTPAEGAAMYEVWFVDIPKFVAVTTNVLDERDFYTFHPTANWMGTIRWRIRAIRADIIFASNSGTSRYNKIPAIQYGPWSPVYSSANGTFPATPPTPGGLANRIALVGTVSDVFSNGAKGSPAHKLMPAFLWSGVQTLGGTSAELYRVYVFSDAQCLNPVFIGSVVGSPAYAPRPYGSLILPQTPAGIAAARNAYLSDGQEPPGYMNDWTQLSAQTNLLPNEDQPHVTPQTTVPGAPGDTPAAGGGSSGGSSSTGVARPSPGTLSWSGDFGAPVDLWDTDWPQGGYYWTVVGVAAQVPGFLETTVVSPGALAGGSELPVASTAGFQIGDQIKIGSGLTSENTVVAGVGSGSLTITGKLAGNHGSGELVVRSGGNLVYRDMELPQDVCAAGRVARFGKSSEPTLTSAGDPFATGLSADGRLISAANTSKFYGSPLVSWTPALGAEAYEVQWSKTSYPFKPELYPGAQFKGMMTATSSAVLPVKPGTWYYRVRGYDYSLPTDIQQMGWSDPEKIVVAAPTFKISTPTGNKFKIVGKGK
ncbi:MAG: hypothetical protein ACXVQ0_12075 [Actinomycetota bacterium]